MSPSGGAALTTLSLWSRELRSISQQFDGCMERVAEDLTAKAVADLSADHGFGDTEQWLETKKGNPPLEHAAQNLHIAVIGRHIVFYLGEPYVYHQFGAGVPYRPTLPKAWFRGVFSLGEAIASHFVSGLKIMEDQGRGVRKIYKAQPLEYQLDAIESDANNAEKKAERAVRKAGESHAKAQSTGRGLATKTRKLKEAQSALEQVRDNKREALAFIEKARTEKSKIINQKITAYAVERQTRIKAEKEARQRRKEAMEKRKKENEQKPRGAR